MNSFGCILAVGYLYTYHQFRQVVGEYVEGYRVLVAYELAIECELIVFIAGYFDCPQLANFGRLGILDLEVPIVAQILLQQTVDIPVGCVVEIALQQ